LISIKNNKIQIKKLNKFIVEKYQYLIKNNVNKYSTLLLNHFIKVVQEGKEEMENQAYLARI
jgi:hypothetical protein